MTNSLRFVRAAAVLCVAGSLAGCDATGPDPGEQLRSQLRAQEALWAEHGSANYSVQIQRRCVCEAGAYDVEIEVVGGEVVSGVHMESGEALTAAELAEQLTLPDLFDVLDDAIDRRALGVNVSYNSAFGYIQYLRIDFDQTTATDDVEYLVDEYTPAGQS